MAFISPIWLLGLVPWGAVTIWVLWGRRRKVPVPFLALWQGPIEGPRAQRKFQFPPLAVAMLLAAMLLALLAASGPRARIGGGGVDGDLIVIVDRGLTMSARSAGGVRFRTMADELWPQIRSRFGNSARLTLTEVPGGTSVRADTAGAAAIVAQLPRTATDTTGQLRAAIAQAIARPHTMVAVISDRLPDPTDARIVRISPRTPLQDVAITRLAAVETPAVQVMATICSRSPRSSALLVVSSGDLSQQRQLELPPRGGERNYFVDLPGASDVISAELRVEDDIDANDRAWLIREGTFARIEPRASLSPELRRMIDAYQSARQPTLDEKRLPITGSSAQLAASESGVIVASARQALDAGPLMIESDEVTQHVHWDALPRPVAVADNPPAGWTVIVSSGSRALVARRQMPARQVWVGFSAPGWSSTPDYVIFWTNVFDWTGGAGRRFTFQPLANWMSEWKPREALAGEAGRWPGLYRRDDGTLRAFNPPAIPEMRISVTDWKSQLASIAGQTRAVDLAPALLACAVVCIAAASAAWARRPKLSRQYSHLQST